MGANPLATVCKANQPFVLVDSPKHDCKRLLLNKNPFKGFIFNKGYVNRNFKEGLVT
jgi:hypothetical protein